MKPLFNNEVQFAGYRDSNTSGPIVSFRLSDRDQLAPFAGMTAAKKGMSGQRIAMCLVEINDDETAKEPLKGGELSMLAGKWNGRKEFRDWLAEHHEAAYNAVHQHQNMTKNSVDSLEVAAQVVRMICGVTTRAELDHNPVAAKIFDEQIRKPYMMAIGVVA